VQLTQQCFFFAYNDRLLAAYPSSESIQDEFAGNNEMLPSNFNNHCIAEVTMELSQYLQNNNVLCSEN